MVHKRTVLQRLNSRS